MNLHLELKHNVSFLKNSNEIDIEKNPKITDDVTQKHEINDTFESRSKSGPFAFF